MYITLNVICDTYSHHERENAKINSEINLFYQYVRFFTRITKRSHPSSHADKTLSILYLAHVVFTVDWTMFVTTTAIYTWITTLINKNINEIDNNWQKHIFLAALAAFREKFLFLFCLINIGSLYIHVTKRFLVYSFLTLDPV